MSCHGRWKEERCIRYMYVALSIKSVIRYLCTPGLSGLPHLPSHKVAVAPVILSVTEAVVDVCNEMLLV